MMKRIALLLLCCLLMTACSQQTPSHDAAVPSSPATAAELVTLSVYRGDANAEGFIFEEVQVPQINETVILEQLIAAGVLPEGTVIHSFSADEGNLSVDFNDVFLQHLNTMGTAGERMVTGSVVNTFLRAFDAKTLSFTVDGQIVESGHVIYDFPLEFME